MADRQEIDKYIVEIFEKDLITYGYITSTLNSLLELYQYGPHDIEQLEFLLELPLTGDLSQMVENYHQNFYTRECLKYHSDDLRFCLEGAIINHHVEIIDRLLTSIFLSPKDIEFYLEVAAVSDNLDMFKRLTNMEEKISSEKLFKIAVTNNSTQIANYIADYVSKKEQHLRFALLKWMIEQPVVDYDIGLKLYSGLNFHHQPFLMRAIKDENLEAIRRIVSYEIPLRVFFGQEIIRAIRMKSLPIFEILIQTDRIYDTRLILNEIIRLGYDPDVASMIHSEKFDKNQALIVAILKGNAYIIPYILQHPITNINSAIELANRKGRKDIVNMLVKYQN